MIGERETLKIRYYLRDSKFPMNNSHLRSSLERLRLLLKVGSRSRSRVEQVRLHLDRALLNLPMPLHVPPLDPVVPPPVVVGATGGSGTRVMVQVLRKAGWFMGNRVNPRNEDSLPIACFLTKWLKRLKDFPNVHPDILARAIREFQRMIHIHRRGVPSPDARWGWKNPRSLWLVPFLVNQFPKLKFVHMIRDARDMMLSENIFFLRQNGHWLLGPDWWRNPEAAQLELWRKSNKRALEFAQNCLKDSYHMVRYEDLVRKPAETISGVMSFLGVPEMDVTPLIEGIHDRGNIGRWRRKGDGAMANLPAEVMADLNRFGYET
jgi:Sulfotransferase family